MRTYVVFAILCLFLTSLTACQDQPAQSLPGDGSGEDEAVRLLLDEIRARQPEPYGLPENNTFNYIWAQYMCALLAAERCGYMERDEAVARLKGMLDKIEPLERYHGFSYDGYDLETNRKTTDKIYFQGWWLFTLAILKNAYPELAPQCESMLAEVDYENSGLFNPETRQLCADYFTDEGKISFWIDLHWQPTGEFRSPYVAYSYITGDISPWTRWATPREVDLCGYRPLGIWHNFYFCAMLMHSVFPDVGYLERSWDELCKAMEVYRKENGMTFYPTRAEPLELTKGIQARGWPNTEHRVAKPWLAWFIHRNAPVMEKAYSPGYGITLYADNMNFYWCYGDERTICDQVVGTDAEGKKMNGRFFLPFEQFPVPEEFETPTPPKLTSLKFYASCDQGAHKPEEPLEVLLNGAPLTTITPDELNAESTKVNVTIEDLILRQENNVLEFRTADQRPGCGYRLYRYPEALWHAAHLYEDAGGEPVQEYVPPPYAEITIDGQQRGGENPYALLARCAVVHNYYPWYELLDDDRFLDTTVNWVGDYYDRAGIGRIVHNVSDTPVTVRYERKEDWEDKGAIGVVDITDDQQAPVEIRVKRKEVNWLAEPRRTYRISYSGS